MEVEIDAAERAFRIALAKNDGDLRIKSESVAHPFRTVHVSVYGFFHKRFHGRFKLFRGFFQADDEFVVVLNRRCDFFFECLDCHRDKSNEPRVELKPKV